MSNPAEDAAPSALPVEIDTTVAHEARVYDYLLGGKDNYPADRAVGDMIKSRIPTIPQTARANRAFIGRSVRYLVREAGIRQFLDIGTGIPTHGNTHQVAQRHAPDSRVVYVDNDPIVLAHARALMTGTREGKTTFLHADLRDPRSIMDSAAVAGTLDLTQPVAIMLVAVLMYCQDSDDPHGIIGTLLDAVPPGSHLVITHSTDAMAAVHAAVRNSGITATTRGAEQIAALFDRVDLLEPGVVPLAGWRPDPTDGVTRLPSAAAAHSGTAEEQPDPAYFLAGVGRKR